MKTILIKPRNAAKLQAALDAAQGRAEVNLLTLQTLDHHAAQAELKLETSCVPSSNRVGAGYTYTPAGPSARAYRYPQGATSISLVRLASGWALESAERVELYPKTAAKRAIRLTCDQRYAAVAAFAASIGLGDISPLIAAASARAAIDAAAAAA